MNQAIPIRILIVDDNEPYRRAFRRNLSVADFDVLEAANADEALQALKENRPDVLVTDLQMRSRREGLELIQRARDVDPLMPIVMISGVGTFEEGAMASRLGAMHVISKSNIDEEIERLHDLIREAHAAQSRDRAVLDELESLRENGGENAETRIRQILETPRGSEVVKSEAYETLLTLNSEDIRRQSRASIDHLASERNVAASDLNEVDQGLEQELPNYRQITEESRESLRTAEYLFRHESKLHGDIDFSRNMGFSYCFAVETEAKSALNRKIRRMLSMPELYPIVEQLLEGPQRFLGVFFHQMLLQLQRERQMDFTIDNVRQVFLRMLEHRDKYKPDGLKALAILILVFGREYEVRTARSKLRLQNPLSIKGLDGADETLELAQCLARLQHYRNPYIHPEISEMEKIAAIREESLRCLRMLGKIV